MNDIFHYELVRLVAEGMPPRIQYNVRLGADPNLIEASIAPYDQILQSARNLLQHLDEKGYKIVRKTPKPLTFTEVPSDGDDSADVHL